MSQQELLKHVTQSLDSLRLDYMITGSTASSFQGEPRSTHDVDIVVSIREGDIDAFLKAFPAPQYYVDRDAVLDAVSTMGMFNVLDTAEGDKVDFWVLTGEPFDRSRFMRRIKVDIVGLNAWISSPEDTILMKLRASRLSGGSERQFTDAIRIYEVQFGTLDMKYLAEWADRLEIGDLWERLKDEAETE